MSKLGAFLKVGALAGALALSSQAYAATLAIPMNYSVELVDGQDSDFGYNRFNRTLTLSEGRHQIVLLFEGTFGNAAENRLIQAANPIVLEIANMPADANWTFTYPIPRSLDDADRYSRAQKINLVDADTKAPLSAEQANYYLLTSDSGFAILRDYRADLASVGRLYAPAPVMKELADNSARVSTTINGVQTVQARSAGNIFSSQPAAPATAAGAVMSTTVTAAAAQNQANATAAAQGQPQTVQSLSSPVSAATYNQLVELYNNADDATKLQFVKYIMSH